MQNIPPQTLDLLILGNEPAGLWLLREYEKLFPIHAQLKKQQRTQPSLGWLKINGPIPPVLTNKPTASFFDLPTDHYFSPEMASTKNLFKWSTQNVRKTFPGLLELFERSPTNELFNPSTNTLNKIRWEIAKNPRLLTYSQTLWKILGRCRQVSPENMVWAALQSTEITSWDYQSLPTSNRHLETWSFNLGEGPVSLTELPSVDPKDKQKIFKITLPSGQSLSTRNLILNLSVGEFIKLGVPELLALLGIEKSIFSPVAQYPLILEFKDFCLPRNVSPLTFFLDEEVLPEPDREVWPMIINSNTPFQKISLWVTERKDFSLESVSEKLKGALSRLYSHFPEALENLESQSVPLGLETCYSDSQRAETLMALEQSSKELYSVSLLHPKTRKKGISPLLPALRCNLPYPVGPLLGAQELLSDLFDKKTLKNSSPKALSAGATSP